MSAVSAYIADHRKESASAELVTSSCLTPWSHIVIFRGTFVETFYIMFSIQCLGIYKYGPSLAPPLLPRVIFGVGPLALHCLLVDNILWASSLFYCHGNSGLKFALRVAKDSSGPVTQTWPNMGVLAYN